MTRSTALLATALAVVVAAGCTSTAEDVDDPVALASGTVEVLDNDFSPAAAEVEVGTTVTWDFDTADAAHNVVFEDRPASDVLEAGTWSRTFEEAGSFTYECTLHGGMDGTIEVVESS